MSASRCDVCPRGCVLEAGKVGACRARGNVGGKMVPLGYGCNLRCPWCQNHSISQAGEDGVAWRELPPDALRDLAVRAHAQDARMAGVAYTYNEPLVCWEYVRDCGELVHEAGLANVLVSAGCMTDKVVRPVAPLIDAANIDLKSFGEKTYREMGGDLSTVRRTIELLADAPTCHLEVTTLVVPGVNDTTEEMERIASWLAQVDPRIVLHVSRFHPSWHKRDVGPTSVARVREVADVARAHLPYVYTGNC